MSGQGYSPGEAPSLETWLNEYYNNSVPWNPADSARSVIGASQALQEKFDKACSEFPEDFWPVIPSE